MPTASLTRSSTDNDESDVFLLYHGRSHVTGNRLGDYLGVPHGRSCDDRVDYLIRWGSRSSVSYRPREEPVNSMRSLRNNADKFQAMQQLDAGGVPVPPFSRDMDELEYPMLGREESHTRGEDINLILQERDDYLTSGNEFYVQYIPTELEYRMHVVDGEVIKVHEKRQRHEADNHPFIRNHETGWIFMEPREEPPSDQLAIDAVGTLGMDFGAVDVIRDENGDEYVLEVNSAPSLDEANLERYGDAFAEYTGLSDVAGMDAVEWDDEDDEPEEAEESDDDSGGLGSIFG